MSSSYPDAGQNARGAGRRFRTEQNELTRPYWAAWLAAIQQTHAEATSTSLARALADRPADRDSHPRALLRSWQQQLRTVSPSNAARVGEAFRTLGVPWSSRALGLYASRHYAEFLVEVRSVAATLDVEYACGLFVYSRILVDFDIYGGLPFAVKLAPRFQAFNEKARREMSIVAKLPKEVKRIRDSLAQANAAVSAPANRCHFRTAGDRTQTKMALLRYLDPALQLLHSTAPPSVAWQAVLPLLDHWLHESLPPASKNREATELLWGASRRVASLSDGTPIIGTIVSDDRDILKALPTAIYTERHRSVLEHPQNNRSEAPK